jgi:hypothetical protein
MAKRISELEEVLTINEGDMLEIAVVDGEAPTGYSSRRVNVSQLVTTPPELTNRFYFSGSEILDEFVSWQFSIPYSQLAYLVNSPPYSINSCGAATLQLSLSAFIDEGSGGGKYGSTAATILYSTDAGSVMNYMSTTGLTGTGVALPHFPPSYIGSQIPPIVTGVLFDELNEELRFTIAIATDVYGTPVSGEVNYKGFVDITMTPYIYGT